MNYQRLKNLVESIIAVLTIPEHEAMDFIELAVRGRLEEMNQPEVKTLRERRAKWEISSDRDTYIDPEK